MAVAAAKGDVLVQANVLFIYSLLLLAALKYYSLLLSASQKSIIFMYFLDY